MFSQPYQNLGTKEARRQREERLDTEYEALEDEYAWFGRFMEGDFDINKKDWWLDGMSDDEDSDDAWDDEDDGDS